MVSEAVKAMVRVLAEVSNGKIQSQGMGQQVWGVRLDEAAWQQHRVR